MTATQPVDSLQGRLLSFGQLRDSALFLATAIYAFGYAIWAVHAAREELGVLPPLEGQYFLAGLVPVLLLAGAALAMRAIVPAQDTGGRQRASFWSKVLAAIGTFGILLPAAFHDYVPQPLADVMIWFILASMGALYLAMALEVRAAEARIATLWLIRLALPAFTFIGTVLYAYVVFPLLPRELGGPRPYCVVIDVAADTLSPETLMLLGADTPATPGAVRSDPLWLRFEGGGTLVMSPERSIPAAPFRLRAGDVALVLPSDGCAQEQ